MQRERVPNPELNHSDVRRSGEVDEDEDDDVGEASENPSLLLDGAMCPLNLVFLLATFPDKERREGRGETVSASLLSAPGRSGTPRPP